MLSVTDLNWSANAEILKCISSSECAMYAQCFNLNVYFIQIVQENVLSFYVAVII